MSTTTLEHCEPSDVQEAVPLIYSSGPDAFDFVFKTNKYSALDFLSFAFKTAGGEFSYQNHYKLIYNGKIVAIGSVFDAKKASNFTIADALKILKFYTLSSVGVMLRGLKVESIIKLPKNNEITIGHLGVNPALRGNGYGTILIEKLIRTTDNIANRKIILDVSEENPRARALYERIGFVISAYNPSNLKNKRSYVPNHFRMENVR